ncbi:MAG: hypothetical protein WA294_04860 [Acidobacteriaceae bacterium]
MKKFLRFLVLGMFCSMLAAPVFADGGSGPSGGDPPPPPAGSSTQNSNNSGGSTMTQLILTLLGTLGL